VRVNVENRDNRLKPGMFVRAVVQARIATGGRVMDAALAGKWISPMHPEVVKDEPGNCDVCGMPLVPAESLGYVGGEPTEDDMPLVIPASAPLLTGKRAIVYVQVPGRDKPTFEGRELVLGPRGKHHYVVQEGLEDGELVVAKGAFKIDAELQIRAKPSMMSPASFAKASEAKGDRKQESGGSEAESAAGDKPQTHCPIMGGEINREVFVDYKGQRIYFCCPGCEGTFLKEPEKYLEKMRSEGIEPEKIGEHHGH
jgi:Cu(I)/Ag(I) efflux system membrane fusion protein